MPYIIRGKEEEYGGMYYVVEDLLYGMSHYTVIGCPLLHSFIGKDIIYFLFNFNTYSH